MAKDTGSGAGANMHTGGETGGTVEGAKRKRRAPEGPRKTKPVHLAVEVLSASGEPIEGATVKVHKATKDFEKFYEHKEANPSHVHVRVPLDNVA